MRHANLALYIVSKICCQITPMGIESVDIVADGGVSENKFQNLF